MGNKQAIIENINTSTVQSVAEVYLAICQDIAQGASAQQNIVVNCSDINSKNLCLECVTRNKNMNKTPQQVGQACTMLCNCNVSNVNLSQNIVYNSRLFMEYTNVADFANMVYNNIAQRADRAQTGITLVSDKLTNANETITRLFTSMKSKSFQQAMENIQQLQTVSLSGPGNIYAVNMKQAVKFVSTILQTNSQTSSIITDLQSNILQLSTQITAAGFDQLIRIIIRIVMAIIILMLLFYTINLIFQVYSLYV